MAGGGDCGALSVRAAGGLKKMAKTEMGALLSCFRSVLESIA